MPGGPVPLGPMCQQALPSRDTGWHREHGAVGGAELTARFGSSGRCCRELAVSPAQCHPCDPPEGWGRTGGGGLPLISSRCQWAGVISGVPMQEPCSLCCAGTQRALQPHCRCSPRPEPMRVLGPLHGQEPWLQPKSAPRLTSAVSGLGETALRPRGERVPVRAEPGCCHPGAAGGGTGTCDIHAVCCRLQRSFGSGFGSPGAVGRFSLAVCCILSAAPRHSRSPLLVAAMSTVGSWARSSWQCKAARGTLRT